MKKTFMSGQSPGKKILHRAQRIKLLILDVDGVMTDGSIILDNEDNEYKAFHVRDGQGIKMLLRAGVQVAIVTGRQSGVVARRAAELGITEVHQKCNDKKTVYASLLQRCCVAHEEVAYMGDDIVDAPVMKLVGMPITVADGDEEVKKFALLITRNKGGRGAVREVTDVILKAKGMWENMLHEYFEA